VNARGGTCLGERGSARACPDLDETETAIETVNVRHESGLGEPESTIESGHGAL